MRKIILIIISLLLCIFALAQPKTVNIQPPRPKVGVVFSGGGAKGASHIGVLKYLEEQGIPVDYVAGTSMGAIIGGLYAMGYTPDELARLIAEMNWSQYVGNRIDRSNMAFETRERSSTQLLSIPFNISNFLKNKEDNSGVSFLPSAYVNNTALINLFNDLCVGYQKDMNFNDLPIPFACVATNIKTGEEVVIRSGSVPAAMRASMAIPGVFAPVSIDGRLLVDGGLVNNFPADVVEEMGADIIIGVEVADKKELNEEEIPSLPELLNGLVNNATRPKRKENRNRCAVYLAPDISGYGMLSFNPDAIDTLVNRGYRIAKEHATEFDKVKQYLNANGGYNAEKHLHAPKAKNLAEAPIFIRSISLSNIGDTKTNWLIRKGKLKIGDYMTEKEINHAVDIYRGTGAFNYITYNITESNIDTIDGKPVETYALVMEFKPTQPHLFGFGARYDTEEGAALLINLGLNGKRLTGYKLNILGKLSYNPKFSITATYSRISLANFNISYDFRSEHFKVLGSNNKYSNLHYRQNQLSGYISQFHLIDISTQIGLAYSKTSFDEIGFFDLDSDSISHPLTAEFSDNRLFSPYLTLTYDNMDHAYFARRGINANLTSHLYVEPGATSKGTSEDVQISIQGYFTPRQGKFTIIPQLYSRCVFGKNLYANQWNMIGGDIIGRHISQQMPFIGVNHVDNVADWTTIVRCDLRYNIKGNHYLAATYNYLIGINPSYNTQNGDENEQYSGLGLRYSYNSPLGPVSLTTQWSNCTRETSVYFSFGYTF